MLLHFSETDSDTKKIYLCLFNQHCIKKKTTTDQQKYLYTYYSSDPLNRKTGMFLS